MKLAVLGDIHGNLPALESVLAHAKAAGAEIIINAGDTVGFGPYPEESVERVRHEISLSVRGNFDEKALAARGTKKEAKASLKAYAAYSAYKALTSKSKEFLAQLEPQTRLSVGEFRILLCHGSPRDIDEGIFPDTDEERLREFATISGADIIVFGHTHIPFHRVVDGVHFINTGSVGRPADGDPRAAYALVEVKDKECIVKHFRVEYDVVSVVEKVRKDGHPKAFARMFKQGRGLEDVQKKKGKAKKSQEDNTSEEKVKEKEQRIFRKALRLADACAYCRDHAVRVMRLALALYDKLAETHGLGDQERFYLKCAAVLHDIGYIKSAKGHHKHALSIILATPALPFKERERLIIGNIARYHRKALPKETHAKYTVLPEDVRHVVDVLAGILRVADGLDRSHLSVVNDLDVSVRDDEIHIFLNVRYPAEDETAKALEKGTLLEHALGKRLAIDWELRPIRIVREEDAKDAAQNDKDEVNDD